MSVRANSKSVMAFFFLVLYLGISLNVVKGRNTRMHNNSFIALLYVGFRIPNLFISELTETNMR